MADSSLPTAGQSAVSTLSDWAGPYVTNMLGNAAAVANQPYQTYQGPLTAGPSAIQNQLFSGIGNLTLPQNYGASMSNVGAYTPPNTNVPTQVQSVSQAANGTQNTTPNLGNFGASGDQNSLINQYMNPYLQASLTPQLNALRQQAQIDEQSGLGKLTSQGAFGGSRQAVLQGMDQNALLGQQANLIGQGYNTAYNNALNQFNTEQTQGQNLANTMANIGGQQQALNQAGVTADYNEFLNQRQYPQQQLQFEQSMLQGLPISTVSNAVQPQTGLASLASTIGGLGSLLTGPTGLTSIINSLNKLGVTGSSSGTTSGSSSGTTGG